MFVYHFSVDDRFSRSGLVTQEKQVETELTVESKSLLECSAMLHTFFVTFTEKSDSKSHAEKRASKGE